MTSNQRRRRTLYATGGVLVVAVICLFAFLLWALFRETGQIEALDTSTGRQQAQVDGLAGAVDSARAQIQSLGATPVVPAPSAILKTITVTGVAGATGAQGPGPSDTQVAAAVAAYLQLHPVPGPSPQEIAAAVTAYLVATPPPSGPAGAQGPGPSDQQIADAVASYMAANPAPSGPAGPQGPAGSPGQDGQPGSPPAGFSITDANGNTENCVPDNQTPAPHYTCTPSSSTSGSPSPSSTDSGSPAADSASGSVRTDNATPSQSSAAASPSATTGSTVPAPTPTPAPVGAPLPSPSPLSRVLAALGVPALRREDIYTLGG